MRYLMNRVEQIWCEQMHSAILWPIHGKYRCARCLREYPATFEETGREPAALPAAKPLTPHWKARPAADC
jgi:hypothetical protein